MGSSWLRRPLEKTRFYDVWRRFVLTGETEGVPPHIRSSWERCKRMGLDPERPPAPKRLEGRLLEALLRKKGPIIDMVESRYAEIERWLMNLPFALVLLDGEGCVLSISGEKEMLSYLKDAGIEIGTSSREEIIGTAAPSLTVKEKRFAMVNGEEHYLRPFHWATCVSFPLFDSERNLIAVLDVTTLREYGHALTGIIPLLVGLVQSCQFELLLKGEREGGQEPSYGSFFRHEVAMPAGSPKISHDNCAFSHIVGRSKIILDLIEKAKAAAPTGSTILIEGETGTGKEMFARAIHLESPCRNGPFIAVNCAAIPKDLVESELFGYERGAFTGALREGQKGKFELAEGGTLFLDEIQAMDPTTQQKVLRAVENREIFRIGGKRPLSLNVRLIAASCSDLEKEVREGRFLPSLFYRLNVVRLLIPPLRERREDIPSLIEVFVDEMRKRFNPRLKGITAEALRILIAYSWPGNVRELKNCIEAASVFCEGSYITVRDLPERIRSSVRKEERTFETAIKEIFEESLRRHRTAREAASSLGIPLSTFYRRLKRLGISPPSRDSHL